jgi:heterodisulfide reductase subunit A
MVFSNTGLAHSPKSINEAATQAASAAVRACAILVKDKLLSEAASAVIKDETKCRGCEKCKDRCAYNAIETVRYINDTSICRVNLAICKGCGACAAVCPSGAIRPQHFDTKKINAMIEAYLLR